MTGIAVTVQWSAGRRWACRCRAQWLPTGTRDPDRHRAGESQSPESAFPYGRSGHVPFGPLWADGIDSGLRAEDAKLCAWVIIGVNEHGEKHFLAIEEGVRESTQSWREVLPGLKARGLNTAELAVGDGAMGFRAALEEVCPGTRQQRCWMHKTANVLNSLPKSAQPKARQALHEVWQAETRDNAEKAFDLFIDQ